MDTKARLDRITNSLRLLALPFEEQVTYFPGFVDVPFEVIDTFDNAVLLLPKLIELGVLDNKSIASVLRLKNVIDLTSSSPEFKNLDVEQFRVSFEWQRVREMAKDTLQVIGESVGPPDLNSL